MFGRKTTTPPPPATPGIEANIQAIPAAFYGGADPLIYHAAPTAVPTVAGTKPADRTAPLGGQWWRSKRFLISAGGFFVIASVGISWYYIRQVQVKSRSSIVSNVAVTAPKSEAPPVASAPVEAPTSTPSPAASPAPALPAPPIAKTLAPLVFPAQNNTDSPNLDADGLTDAEEEAFHTDSGKSDTDSDGYPDGVEVMNLYSPVDPAPAKIIDSGLVREYINPTAHYRLYYVNGWEPGVVDPEAREVLFNASNGDFIDVRVSAKNSNQSFPEWFALQAAGELFTDLQPMTNRFGVAGWKRPDDLVYYFATPDMVFVLAYRPNISTNPISYRHILAMMAVSFRPTEIAPELPPQAVLPSPQ